MEYFPQPFGQLQILTAVGWKYTQVEKRKEASAFALGRHVSACSAVETAPFACLHCSALRIDGIKVGSRLLSVLFSTRCQYVVTSAWKLW